jgi:hypothetical protein
VALLLAALKYGGRGHIVKNTRKRTANQVEE